MKQINMIFLTLYSMSLLAGDISLLDTMKSLDDGLFESFNTCQNPEELEKYASYFSDDVEFYHDNGGVTWDRKSMISNTQKNACGNYTRKRVAGTFESYPINRFGAITKGVHIFCQNSDTKCEGKSDFLMVWKKLNDKWIVTRVLSYGHRENK